MRSDVLKVSYIHGRNGPHPMQGKLARSVGGEYVLVDFKIRWHDLTSPRLRRYLSWLVCSLTFPNKGKYDIFLAAGPHFTMPLMRAFFQISPKQKIIVHLGDETLYSLLVNRYSGISRSMLIRALRKYDAVICEGKMGADIARSLLGPEKPIYTVFPGIPKEHYLANKAVKPNLKGNTIIFMANGPAGFRTWYKGLDLLLDSFAIAYATNSKLTLTVIGDWDKNVIESLTATFEPSIRSAIRFVSSTNNLQDYLKNGSLYVHCARGEAFGITILIALLAGIPSIVSEWTGAKEAVKLVSNDLITPLDKNAVAERILWYFNLPDAEKQKLSERGRSVAENYTEEKAIECYRNTFKQIIQDFQLDKTLCDLPAL